MRGKVPGKYKLVREKPLENGKGSGRHIYLASYGGRRKMFTSRKAARTWLRQQSKKRRQKLAGKQAAKENAVWDQYKADLPLFMPAVMRT